ncbi:protein of unknown function [Trichlorobacter ammonificans]|uniref:Uncharacterized protein n=1 Tax=Trichlorobacter ammonificans TaxID=2916410 RepID=A0ABM9D4W1_9BACT|nr:protein of unknown function [Trichlorobacter ammonificans]
MLLVNLVSLKKWLISGDYRGIAFIAAKDNKPLLRMLSSAIRRAKKYTVPDGGCDARSSVVDFGRC